jgi:excisionase family DNA binding protein
MITPFLDKIARLSWSNPMVPDNKKRPRKSAVLGYTVTEAAEVIGIGRNQMYQAIARGEIEVERYGRRIIVKKPAPHKRFGDGV